MFDTYDLTSLDNRKHAPATERNRDAIWAVLDRYVPSSGHVIEVAAGTGQHMAAFAPLRPNVTWWPGEPDLASRQSIAAWCADLPNVASPVFLDAAQLDWGLQQTDWPNVVDVIFAANVTHIAPWEVSIGLLRGAAARLRLGGALIIYGPFRRVNELLAQSNLEFDYSLRKRNENWGIRVVEDLDAVARSAGLEPMIQCAMPANNMTLIWRKAR